MSALHRDCPARLLLDQIADKWTVLVICVLDEGPSRFNELRRRVDGISQKVLASTLRGLERNGMVERTVATTGPVSVTYRLTNLGTTLYEPMLALYGWTTKHIDAVVDAQEQFDRPLTNKEDT
ncbi:transcriptional regulator [Rhodococcus sp. 06-156-3C]|nr:transcriptional regulator [Rhodococcus sp. 06-156-4a]OZD15762.1 transcriptional regulator [Rhodococcus sp. 06-156-3C]OZD21146.1 transcriptional regulator [Rhodococcus sp. 06-156-4C]OZD32390.1 transcriptional regulator [Rhodococcus sp. 06-156-3]OZD36550.1 transcriptional regulator [Rhodococcus sp. 06-156-3b]OZF59270.1 transcriptional regulator [Rhodococcus sp. 06-156-4]